MDCVIDKDTLRCRACFRVAVAPDVRRNCRPGLGDMVAAGLDAVGITKNRFQRLANAVGVTDCGCAGRQAALNRAGYQLGIGTPPPAKSGPTG